MDTVYQPKRTLLNLAFLIKALMVLFIVGVAVGSLFPGLNEVNRVMGMGLVGISCLLQLKRRNRIAPEVIAYTLFILWCLLSGPLVARSSDLFWDSFSTLAQIAAMVFAVTGICFILKSADIPQIGIIICAIVGTIYSIATGAFSGDQILVARDASVFLNPNVYGIMAVLAIICIMYFWPRRMPLILRAMLAGLIVLFIVAIIYTGSRKSFISLPIFLIAWLWFCYRKYILRHFYILVVIIAIAYGAYVVVNDYIWTETILGYRLELSVESDTFLGDTRSGLYAEGVQIFLDNPVAGIGLGNFVYVSSYHYESHSDYIEALACTGVIGFLIYFSIYPFLWLRITRLSRKAPPEIQYQLGVMQALVVTVLVLGITRITFQSIYYLYTLAGIFGYTFALSQQQLADRKASYHPDFRSYK